MRSGSWTVLPNSMKRVIRHNLKLSVVTLKKLLKKEEVEFLLIIYLI